MDSRLPTKVISNVSHISKFILMLSLNSVLNIRVSTSNGTAFCIAVIGEGSAPTLSVLVKCQHCEHRQVQMDTAYSNVCFFLIVSHLYFFLFLLFLFLLFLPCLLPSRFLILLTLLVLLFVFVLSHFFLFFQSPSTCSPLQAQHPLLIFGTSYTCSNFET